MPSAPKAMLALLRFPLVIATVALAGCPPRVPPRTDPARILEWTLGRQNLASPTAPEAFLLLIPKEKLAPKPAPSAPKPSPSPDKLATSEFPLNTKDALSECVRATSVLPLPQDDGRILLAVDGAVHILDRTNKTTTAVPSNMDRSLHIDRLLALRKVPDGIEILVSVQMEGRAKSEVYSLIVQSDRIVMGTVADLHYDDAVGFFSTYTVPHCTTGGKECLGIAKDDDVSYVEQWAAVGNAAPVTLARIEGAVDATWAPTDDGSIYVLKSCQAAAQSSP